MEATAGELQAALGSVPLIGCSTSSELTDGRSLRRSLVLWALGGAGFSVRVGMGQGKSGSLRVASRQAAGSLDGLPSHPHRALVILADGLCGDQMEVVRGAYEMAGASVPLGGDAPAMTWRALHLPDPRSEGAQPGRGGHRQFGGECDEPG